MTLKPQMTSNTVHCAMHTPVYSQAELYNSEMFKGSGICVNCYDGYDLFAVVFLGHSGHSGALRSL